MKRAIGTEVAVGAAAGVVGTAVIRGLMQASMRLALETLPPMKEDPGRYMVKQAKRALPGALRAKLTEPMETKAATLLGFAYGMSFGALYAGARPRHGNTLAEGAVVGGAAWAAGALGWLPATRLTPPVWKQELKQVVPNFLSHLIFGIATVAVAKWVGSRVSRNTR